MKTESGCAGCIVDDISGAAKLMGVDTQTELKIVQESMKYLAQNMNYETLPSEHITAVHRIAKRISGQTLPFEKLRKNCNDVGLKLSDKLAKSLKKKKDSLKRFETLVKWVVASNHLDFRTVGTGYKVPLKKIEEHVYSKVKEPFTINDLRAFYNLANKLPKAKDTRPLALYIHDNVGEIAFDRLLIQDLRLKGWTVVSALRGGPITSDATLEDGLYVKMQEYADFVICAGPDTLGISWKEKSPELAEFMKKADLIVSKGQANFYLFSDYYKEIGKPIMCLLTTKCPYVSSYFKNQKLISVAKLLK